MGLNGILSSALTTLQTNTAALRVVSHNVSNVNTPNYSRRVVNLEVFGSGGVPVGVTIQDIQRVADKFLTQEALSATSSAALYDSQSTAFDQINALLGSPGDGNALTSKLSKVFTALGQAALSPTTPSSQNSVMSSLQSLASSISSLSQSLGTIATNIDAQITTSVETTNNLIKQIYDFNNLIKMARLHGETDTTYLDERDKALYALAQQMDLRTTTQDDGRVLVATGDGLGLVSDSYAQISYSPGQNGVYQPIVVQDTNPSTGGPIGTSQTLDSHLFSGQIRGLLDMRDGTLADLRNELGAFAQSVAVAFNREHNANSAYPPPETLVGRQTGLLGTDQHNFTGKTTIALTNAAGVQQASVVVDFSAGSLSVNGGAAINFGSTINDFVTALNANMPLGGSATFTDGVLTISGGANGVVVSDANTSPASSRGGTAFSHFFGLNDLFTSSVPSILKTGLEAADPLGLSANGTINFVIKGPHGEVARTATVNVNAAWDVGTTVAAINTALGGYATLSLSATDGSISTAVSSSYPGYALQVTGDTTARGSTGVSITSLFGIGTDQLRNQAEGFNLNSAIANDPTLISLARPSFSTTQIVGAGDATGLLALQNLATAQEVVAKAGNLGAQVTTLGNYASAFYQDIATQSAAATNNKTTQDDRLEEANSRLVNHTGVSLDEELSNMIIYQQAYSAGARMLTMVGELYDTLLNMG